MNRLVIVSGAVLAFAFAVATEEGCASSDNTGGRTNTASGGSGNASSGGSGNATASGGTVGMSGSASMPGPGTGGVPAAAGTGGAATTTGGTASGGATASGGTSGSSSVAGSTSTAGAAGTGAAPAPCDATVAKAGPCTTAGSVCAKTCGPDKTGYKTETCTAGAYAEGVCTFPPGGSYTCYHKTLPLMACDATATGPVASSACTATPCVPCGPAYQDSKMAPKTGACVCTANKWSCASDAEWPPQ